MKIRLRFLFICLCLVAQVFAPSVHAEEGADHFYVVNNVFQNQVKLRETSNGFEYEKWAWITSYPLMVAGRTTLAALTPAGVWGAVSMIWIDALRYVPTQIGMTYGRLRISAEKNAKEQMAEIFNQPNIDVEQIFRLAGTETKIKSALTRSLKMNSLYVVKTKKALPEDFRAVISEQNGAERDVKFAEIKDLGEVKLRFNFVRANGELMNEVFEASFEEFVNGTRLDEATRQVWEEAFREDIKSEAGQPKIEVTFLNGNFEIPLGTFMESLGIKTMLGLTFWEKIKTLFRKLIGLEASELRGRMPRLKVFENREDEANLEESTETKNERENSIQKLRRLNRIKAVSNPRI